VAREPLLYGRLTCSDGWVCPILTTCREIPAWNYCKTPSAAGRSGFRGRARAFALHCAGRREGSGMTRHVRLQAGFAAMVLATSVGMAQQGARGGEWRWHSGDLGSTKYSPLDQITRDNVA